MSAASSVDFDGAADMSRSEASSSPLSPPHRRWSSSDSSMGSGERAVSAAGAAFLSAILVNPLDVAKTRLQAQAAGVPYYPSQHHYGRQMASLGPNTILQISDVFHHMLMVEYSVPNQSVLILFSTREHWMYSIKLLDKKDLLACGGAQMQD